MTDEIEQIVMMPPYVAEEHRQLLDNAENALNDYSELLLNRIKKELNNFKYGHSEAPESMVMAERVFHDDPLRQQLIRSLGEIRMLVERPRFMVPAGMTPKDMSIKG
jgi:hypothetical protein